MKLDGFSLSAPPALKSALDDAQLRVQRALGTLAPRERRLVIAGGALLAVLLAYLTIWEPLVNAHARRQADLEASRALALRIEQAGALVQARQATAPRRGGSLLAIVDQTSQQPTLGKAPSRLQPDGAGDKGVKVWFEDVPFDKLVRWLAELQARHGAVVVSAEFAAGSAPGLVSAQLNLSR